MEWERPGFVVYKALKPLVVWDSDPETDGFFFGIPGRRRVKRGLLCSLVNPSVLDFNYSLFRDRRPQGNGTAFGLWCKETSH